MDDTACTLEARAGIAVNVTDSLTRAWAASGAEALMVAQSGFRDSVSFEPNQPELDSLALSGAYEHAGVYTVTVRKAGYADWTKTGVSVTEGECHVNTVRLTAKLQQ